MLWQAFGVGSRFFSAAGAWRVGVVGCALLLAACGGNAKDRERAPELKDLGNRVPGVFEFPEGGRDFGGASGLISAQFAPDQTGALWFVGCGGLFVIDDGQARFYDATISALPEGMTSVTVDASNRKWVIAGGPDRGTLGVFEQGQFRPVLEETGYMQLASAANGVVWAHYPERDTSVPVLRQVAPTLGEPLDERFERGLEEQQATLAGFAPDQRQLWIDDEELLSVENGVAQDRQTMPGKVRAARVSWDGAIYVFTHTTLYRLQDGALTEVLDLLEFSGGCRSARQSSRSANQEEDGHGPS